MNCAARVGLALLLALPVRGLAAPPRPISASSEAVASSGGKHLAANAFDGLLSTGWAEGELGDGNGAWLELRFDKPVDVESISIFPGWLGGSDREIREYGRPKLVTLSFEVASGEPVVKQERLLDPGESGPLRHDVAISVPQARAVRITFDEVLAGGLYSDTFVSEVAVNLVDGKPVPAVSDVTGWLASEAGLAAAEKSRTEAIAMYDAISGSEFGDRDKLRVLMEWAADGAPYLRERVARVTPGFRVQPLQPDKTAIEALLKLKDSNAIPAIERAALRVTGSLADDLRRRAKLFDAYQELLGGGGRNIPPWGQEGFGKGALRSLGEPLDIVADGYGALYVADVGNNRVQRFGLESGVTDRQWGAAEPGVTDVWFTRKREAYASGSMPGEEPGSFTNPVDLAVVPGKEGDRLLVLDARGRITVIEPDDSIGHVQKITTDMGIGSGAGGEGHIVTTKGKAIAIYGNEGFVWDLEDWTELGRFTLEDGVPTSAVAFKNGKLGLVYGPKLVLYSTDGFRHGDVIGESLGEGYQDWAVTLDERGKLWAVLDTGRVVKFKKPGKVDYSVKLGTYSFENPRIAVFADNVFVTEGDRIVHADALDLLAKEAAGVAGDGTLQIPEDE